MADSRSLLHEHFRALFLAERERRSAIRGSIGTPVAAISFAVFALGTLTTEYEATRWAEPVGIVMAILATGSLMALCGAVWHVVMVEWLFVHHEPPPLSELRDAEATIAKARGAEAVDAQMTDLLTVSYAIAYEQYLCGNTVSARNRTRALRFVLLALTLLAFAFVLLPPHKAGAGAPHEATAAEVAP